MNITRRAPSKMQLLESANFSAVVHLTLPPHAVPGQVFEVFIGTQIICVTCPKTLKAGDTVRIMFPAFPVSPLIEDKDQSTAQVRQFVHPSRKTIGYIVTVPPGVEPETCFMVKIDGQPAFRLRCPSTHRPGMSVQCIPPPLTREGVIEEYGMGEVSE